MTETVSLKIDDEEIVFADLTNRENLEIVAVCKSGNIFLVDLESSGKIFLGDLSFDSVPNLLNDFNPLEILQDLNSSKLNDLLQNIPPEIEPLEKIVEKNPQILDNLSLKLNLYSFQNYICLVQEKGTNGIVLDLSKPNYRKQLKRGDYCANVSSFPIAFHEKDSRTFLIHGTDWNRLDITCLETEELLTSRIVDYDTDSNYFDYFHSSLLVSPDAEHFTSNGWVWHPYDIITVYSIDKFLQEFEMSHISVDFDPVDGYNWDRPLCWINNSTLGIGYNRKENEENKGEFPSEVVFVDILENKIINRVEFNGFELADYGAAVGELFFDSEKNHFIGLNKKSGLLIADVVGNEIFKDNSLTSYRYSKRHKLFYKIAENYKLIEIINLEI